MDMSLGSASCAEPRYLGAMTRRSTRKPVVIPAGWTAHDGSGMPVLGSTSPGVIFRIGTRTKVGAFDALHWQDRAEDSWSWSPGSTEPMDIIAFREEPDEWVTIPRLSIEGLQP